MEQNYKKIAKLNWFLTISTFQLDILDSLESSEGEF